MKAHRERRFAASGVEIRIGSELSVTLAMAFHELVTNALKYGALSVPNGRIRVIWHIEEAIADGAERMTIVWSEHGGPAVKDPSRRGFGSELIEKGLARQLGGTALL